MYDGTALHMSTADAPDTVIARADTCGFTTQPWEVTEYCASITSTEVWLRINSEYGEHLIDVCPFWGKRPAAITFAAGEHAAALPVIACPTAPDDRRPWHGRDRGKDRDVNGSAHAARRRTTSVSDSGVWADYWASLMSC
ncbi:hypothetical protein QFZ22_009573 [Streptomyces canus]|uniref:Uncharacterized protein n=1 Tax=Streptomyces canus TaxID=58343 RepID=A0AAW8FTZ9_9ACTN|nr:hypothetical protein [Streptomyces canus]MDQ0913501.1 hypothetical protein [Streptomyces canus]